MFFLSFIFNGSGGGLWILIRWLPDQLVSLRPIRPTVILSSHKQPNLACELHVLTWMGCAAAHFFGPPPGALGRDQKVCLSVRPSVRYTPKQLDEFQPNFVYKLLT